MPLTHIGVILGFGYYKHSTAKSLLRVHIKHLHIIVLETLGSILKLVATLLLIETAKMVI